MKAEAASSVTVDDLPELRRLIVVFRALRRDAHAAGNWSFEVFVEQQLNCLRQRYRSAIAWLRCPHL